MVEIKGLTKTFGGVVAVDRLDMSIGEGEFVGLIGPNGAGKTTVFNLLTGFLRPTRGRITLDGKDITGKKPHVIAEMGMVRTFQISSLFSEFTVLQNVMAACHLKPRVSFWEAALHTSSSRRKEEEILNRATELMKFAGLNGLKDVRAGTLPHGHKRLLGIAVALSAQPKVLLLDEPLSGMNAEEVSNAMTLINEIWRRGTAILLVEHNMRAAMSLCKRVVVINFGKKIAEGSPEEIRQNKEVIRAYLGGAVDVA